MEYLPAIYQEAEPAHPKEFLGQFLLAFERLLLGGMGEEDTRALEAVSANEHQPTAGLGDEITRLHRYFDPRWTPEEFLPWLAGWAALTLRADLSLERKRKLLARIIPLYRIRGTKDYLQELLNLSVDAAVQVSDTELPELEVGSHSTVGSDTYLGGGAPYFFQVRMFAPRLSPAEVEAQMQIAREVIELGKPAHTDYDLAVVSPLLQVGVHSSIGVDTVLGPETA